MVVNQQLRSALLGLVVLAGAIGFVIVIGEHHVADRAGTRPSAAQQRHATAASNAQSSSVDQQALQKCLAEQTVNCATTVPGLAQCMAAKGTDCNHSAAQQMIPAQINATSGASITQNEAIDAARQSTPGVLADAMHAASAPAVAAYMTLSQYVAMEPAERGAFPALSPTRMVWVVTVHAPVYNEPLPGQPATLVPSYTVVLDAVTGQDLATCGGCAGVG